MHYQAFGHVTVLWDGAVISCTTRATKVQEGVRFIVKNAGNLAASELEELLGFGLETKTVTTSCDFFHKLGVLFVGVLATKALITLLLGVYIRGPVCWKLPVKHMHSAGTHCTPGI